MLAPGFAPPDFLVPTAQDKSDDAGKLIDEPTHEMLQKRMDSYLEWVRRLTLFRGAHAAAMIPVPRRLFRPSRQSRDLSGAPGHEAVRGRESALGAQCGWD